MHRDIVVMVLFVWFLFAYNCLIDTSRLVSFTCATGMKRFADEHNGVVYHPVGIGSMPVHRQSFGLLVPSWFWEDPSD